MPEIYNHKLLIVDLSSMSNCDDKHHEAIVLDRGDDPIIANPEPPQTFKVTG